MFRPLECFIGLRYLGSGRRRGMVSFMSMASLLGIALGVAALIVILSVMNGLEGEFRTRLLTLTEHVRVWPEDPLSSDPVALEARLRANDAVRSVTPFTELEVMLSAGAALRPALLRGIPSDRSAANDEIAGIVGEDLLGLLQPGTRHVILGRFLALNLGVSIGDGVTVLLAELADGRPDLRRARFEVVGVFDAGVANHDANLALTSLGDAGALISLGEQPEGLAVRLEDPMYASEYQSEIEAELGSAYRLSNWADENRSLFRAMAIEKTMMTIILMFIVGVAAFNIVASLMMVVTEKEKDIAILRTYGLEPGRVVRIFFVQGAVLGTAGILLGTAAGIALALNVETIVPWLETTFNFKIMPGDVFYVTEVPSELQLADVVVVPLFALLITVLATLFPSRRAARVEPAEALRYE